MAASGEALPGAKSCEPYRLMWQIDKVEYESESHLLQMEKARVEGNNYNHDEAI